MSARSKDFVLGVVAAAVLVAASTIVPSGDVLAAPSGEILPTVCWLQAATGHECPTCGMTRSFVAFFHGDFRHAFRFHPIGPALAAGTVLVLALVVVLALARRAPLWGRPAFVRAVSIAAGTAVVVGVARTVVGGLG